MNDILKLADKAVRPLGYRLIRRRQLEFLPVTGLDDADGALARTRESLESTAAPTSDTKRLTVFLRTCLRGDRRVRPCPITGDTREAAILASVSSLVATVNDAKTLFEDGDLSVIADDDRSDADARDRIAAILSGLTVPWDLRTPKETLAGPVMHAQFREGADGGGLAYFVEDDYLHVMDALAACVRFYREIHHRTGRPLVLHPQEQAAIYHRHDPCYIVLGAGRRWRTTRGMTHTLLLHGDLIRHHWSYFEDTKFVGHPDRRTAHRGSETRTTNRLLGLYPGFCPMPSLAGHFQVPETLPPFFDWEPLFADHRNMDAVVTPTL